ncbi:MAG: GNAT family N-acetyltransferase [Pseudomonadota bacterium]
MVRSSVRRAGPRDAAALLPLVRGFYRAEGIPFRKAKLAHGLRRLLREGRLGVVVVAEDSRSKALLGYAIGTFGFDLEFAGPDSFLTDLFVDPRHRRGGVGRRLLQAALRELAGRGARAVTLLVWPRNRAARLLYAGVGFRVVERVAMVRVLRAVRRAA